MKTLWTVCFFWALGFQTINSDEGNAGFLDFDKLPVTRFSCEGKVIGGYYADVETGCQMFHVCTLGQKDEVQDIKFLCLNGTVFDQETRVCERVDEVDCSKAEGFYDLNLELYAPQSKIEREDDSNEKIETPVTTTTTSTTTVSPRTKPPAAAVHHQHLQSPQAGPSSSSSGDNKSGKGYSAFNYYLRTPHSHVASGYNSQSRQSYVINNQQSHSKEQSNNAQSQSQSQGRKVASGPQTIIYSTSSSTVRPQEKRVPQSSSSSYAFGSSTPSTTTQKPRSALVAQVDEDYEYYDEDPKDYASTSSRYAAQAQSKPQQFISSSSVRTIPLKETLSVSKSTSQSKGSPSSKYNVTAATTEAPYYYIDEDYEDTLPPSKSNSLTFKNGAKSDETSDSDYYDDSVELNAQSHHFTHVDVPRIPYAKPNVPRVLITNGKPFLPRLRRHFNEDPGAISQLTQLPSHHQQHQPHHFSNEPINTLHSPTSFSRIIPSKQYSMRNSTVLLINPGDKEQWRPLRRINYPMR